LIFGWGLDGLSCFLFGLGWFFDNDGEMIDE